MARATSESFNSIDPIALSLQQTTIDKNAWSFVATIYIFRLRHFNRRVLVRRWFMYLFSGRPFSGSNRRWLAGVVEAVFAAALMLVGVVCFVVSITLAVLKSTPDSLYISVWFLVLQILVAISLIVIGSFLIARLLWQVGVSAERRGALASRAYELELLNDIRRRREDLPTVPRDHFAPQVGKHLPFRLTPSPRNLWGLATSTAGSVIMVALVTILILIISNDFQDLASEFYGEIEGRISGKTPDEIPDRPWLAAALLVPIGAAAIWSVFQFFLQLLKLTGIGGTSIEVSGYPLSPGNTYQVSLSQTARVRLKLLDVALVCVEEATYRQGTDVRTESAVVYNHRLFRQRGVDTAPGVPFSTEFELAVPKRAMHSFKSSNNRVQWKIVVTAQAKSWPRLNRNFAVSVHPPSQIVLQRSEP